MKKICSKCNQEKDLNEYNWRNEKKGWKHSFCKECHTKYRHSHYVNNKKKYLAKARKWNKGQVTILRKFIFDYLSDHFCVDCGNKDVRVLDFDHVGNKRMGIAQMMRNCHSLESVTKEISVCNVRCANCHRIKTFERGFFWKTKMVKNIGGLYNGSTSLSKSECAGSIPAPPATS